LALLPLVPPATGSGGLDCDDMDCNSFFAPEIIQSPSESPFFRSNRTFYGESYYFGRTSDNSLSVQEVNLGEWANYLGGMVPRAQLSFLLYKLSFNDLRNLIASMDGKDVELSNDAQMIKTALMTVGRRDRLLKSLEYLVLAKQVEPIATRAADQGWNSGSRPKQADAGETKLLIEAAQSQLRNADKFIAERFRFQAIRLMYYGGQYADAQNYFEQNKDTFTTESSPKYRFTELAAGAYYKDKKYGKANYLFSLVFDKFAPLRRSAYASFHPMEDPDWNETLSLARNAHEKEVLWQLLGIYADGLAAIDKIYGIDPKSKLLPLLLVREVNKAEEDWTANQDRFVNGVGNGNGPRPDLEVIGEKRLQAIKAIADAGNTYKPYLWTLSAGHLFALAGDSDRAEQYIQRSMKSMPDAPDVRAQARVSLLFARVRAIKSIEKAAEPHLAQEYEWLQKYVSQGNPRHYRAGTMESWARTYLSRIYLKGSDPMRALMLADSPESDDYRSVAGIDRILEFVRTPKTAFDKVLAQNYDYSVAQLHELRALQFLYAGDFTRAVEAFQLAGEVMRELAADPFMIHIKDCHDCDFQAPHTTYTKKSFAERMLALSRTAQGQGEQAAAASFELANGFYNMSYYGNGRSIYDTAHENLYPRDSNDRNAELALNMDRAEKYYLQAVSLSSNREFKAKAIFMAAKAEQNRRYNVDREDNNKVHPSAYFTMLFDSYSDTQYYQEIVRECAYFH